MGSITLQIPVIGQPASTEDPKVASNFGVIQTAINGNLDSTNLSASADIALSQIAPFLTCAVTQPTRALSTVYQPNVTRPTFITALFLTAGGGGNFPTANIGATNTPNTGVALADSPASIALTLTFLVPPAWYYELSGGTLQTVTEWTL